MIRFLDGPAAGMSLYLARAPKLLRVVRGSGYWDALDQLGGTPAPDEEVYVYAREGNSSYIHIDYQKGGRRVGETFLRADYRALAEQPGEEHTRDNGAWRAWTREHTKEKVHKTDGGVPKHG